MSNPLSNVTVQAIASGSVAIAHGANILASFSGAPHIEAHPPAEVHATDRLAALLNDAVQKEDYRYEDLDTVDEERRDPDGMREVDRARRLLSLSEVNPNTVYAKVEDRKQGVRKRHVAERPPHTELVRDVIAL